MSIDEKLVEFGIDRDMIGVGEGICSVCENNTTDPITDVIPTGMSTEVVRIGYEPVCQVCASMVEGVDNVE